MMNTRQMTPEEVARNERGVAFAKAWMARKRAEQKEMAETAMHDPAIIAARAELNRRAIERGSRVVEL